MRITGPVDAIILEGWFIGAQPQSDSELAEPVNQLEAVADADGRWRHYVNHQLGQKYQELFSKLHMLIMLQAPSFEQVFQWRSLQEEKLRQQNPEAATGLMDDDSLRRFIEHFERLTRHCLQTIPARSEAVFRLDQSHRVIQSL
jgi:D-glycerate 3-kinase